MTGIAIDPVTPARVYATASLGLDGGIFRSTDAGAPSSQTFSMPAPWTPLGTTGVRYVDNKGVNGQVKLAQLSKTAKGTFELKVKIQGKLGPGEQPHVRWRCHLSSPGRRCE
jgi:hypothetical protein